MREHERKLKLAFSDLDHNKDGNSVLSMHVVVVDRRFVSTSCNSEQCVNRQFSVKLILIRVQTSASLNLWNTCVNMSGS